MTKQNDLYQKIQFLTSVVIIPLSDDCIKIWKYLDIGKVLTVPQGNANFVSREVIKNPFQSRDKILLYYNQRDHTERYSLWFIVLKMDVVNHLNLLHCWKNIYLQAIIKEVLKYVQ